MTSRTPSNESSDVEDPGACPGADIPTQKLESSLSCRKQGWLPFPPGKNGSSSFRGSSDPSIALLDNLQADGKSSSIAIPLDVSHSTLSLIPSPKLYKIKVEKLFYNLPPPNRSTLTKLKQFCTSTSPCPPKNDNEVDDDDVYGKSRRYILRNINFEAKPGELLGIAGSSGSGKSTILECLAGRLTPSSPPGSILVNNQIMKTSTFRRISGYVMQDDALFPHLTVFETLLFSARLRLPSTTTMTEKLLRVQGLLIELGLQHAVNTRIGNEMVRGVSGGERRRVSIGVDVIHDPAVLLLDEPTSGLDSAAAFNVVAMLRAMAVSRKRTVILSIHQPSLKILELIQSVLLVAGGMVVHHGSLDLLAARLATAGHEVTAETNLLEYAIEAVNSWEKEEFTGTDGVIGERGKKLTMDQMLALSSDLGTCEDSNLVDSEKGDGHKDGGNGPAAGKFQLPGGQDDNKSDKLSYANNIFRETAILVERFFMNICRTKELFVARSIQAICAGTILGTVFLKMHNDRTGVQNRMGFFVFTVSFLLQSTTEALPIFLSERQVLQRETSRGAYRISSYVLSNALVFLPFFLFIAILYGAPSYWLTGLVFSPFNFLFYCLILWLTLVLANTFVALFSAIVPNYIMGQAVFGAFMGAFFLFSGYIINRKSIPKYWIWVHYISLFKYPYQALLLNEFLPNKDRCYDYGSSTVPAEAGVCLLTGSQVLNNIGVQGRNKWTDVAVTVAFIFFYHLNTYAAVRWRLNRCSR